ncbi:MAG: aminotransferase class I/II-fold pyridoxal phosphate-dependent enzyme, partial [Firmicutes bacterium]|nr:aminotransferase class I/II-fold pyridoxal phosphate-dependent enzyme [Bacillota bacterium]
MQHLLRPALIHLRPYVPGRAGPPADPGGVMLASNENPRGPSPRAIQEMAEALGSVHRYPDFSAQRLREQLARRWHLTPEHVLVGNGSGLIIAAVARALINPGDEGLVMTPSFSSYQQAIAIMGGRVRELPLREDQFLELREILAGLTPWTKLLYLCNPNNPTGSTLPPVLWHQLFDQLPPTTVVVVDEAYAEYASPPTFASAIPWVSDQRPLLVLRTFSKVYGLAGLRIGYALGPPPL